jgi:hypothetical protein
MTDHSVQDRALRIIYQPTQRPANHPAKAARKKCAALRQKTGEAMSIAFQALMMLAWAYAGWETASFQLEQPPAHQQLTQIGSSQSNRPES